MVVPPTAVARRRGRCLIALIGGGAVGSHAAPLVARLPQVTDVRLVDMDTYSAGNLVGQAIDPADVGRAKVAVLARRLRRQAPHLAVHPSRAWVEDVPRGLLRADVVLSCVDSRRARASLNEICWRLGVPLIDAGVDAAGLLVRTNLYVPGPGRACLVCAWSDRDYAAQEQVYACQGAAAVAATQAPASLGTVAAGLLVQMCQQWLERPEGQELPTQQILWDIRHARCLATRYTPNPECRFDHRTWRIETAAVDPGQTPVAEFLAHWSEPGNPVTSLQLEGHQFVRRLVCAACGRDRSSLLLDRALTPARSRCRCCGATMLPSGFHTESELPPATWQRGPYARQTLGRLGLVPGDIVTLRYRDQRCRHVELAGAEPAIAAPPLPTCSREPRDVE